RRVVKETGKQGTVSGFNCDEYTFDLQAPTGPSHGIQLVEHDNGTACVSEKIPEGVEVTNFVLEARKRGYTMAASFFSPTTSFLGPYFFAQQPNVIVLRADAESKVGPTELGFYLTSHLTISDIRSDVIPDEDFQIPTDWKQVKDKQPR